MTVHITTPTADKAPPASSVGVMGWLRKNLFSSATNSIFTLIGLVLIYKIVPPALNWAFFTADWVGSTKGDCTSEGACWVFVIVRKIGRASCRERV